MSSRDRKPAETECISPGAGGNGEAPSVLVVDDDRATARLIALTLRAARLHVREAFDGLSAVQTVAHCQPDLVLLDVQLPDIDGREVFRQIRDVGFDGPVVVVSAHGARSARRELGADAAIEKPFDPTVVLQRVERLLAPRESD